VARMVSADRDLPAVVTLIVLSLLGCVATHLPADPHARGGPPLSPSFPDPEEAGSQHRPAMFDFETSTTFFGIVPDAMGIRRYVAASEVVPEARRSVFGILTIDAGGNPRFLATTEIPNVHGQAYGWFIWVGDSTQPVRWTQTFTSTRPPAKQSTVEPEPSIFSSRDEGMLIAQDETGVRTVKTSISPDGRTAITQGESPRLDGFIWNSGLINPGTPPGSYEIAVSLPGGRTETFSFALGEPQASHQSFEFCRYMDVYVDWWWARYTLDGDPDESNVTERVLTVFTDALMLGHRFSLVEEADDAYWVASANASKNVMNPEMTHGFVHMRTLADLQGGAVRRTLHTAGELIDFQLLFEVPLVELDAFIRGLAGKFAEKLFPHAHRLCEAWSSGQLDEETRLERMRKELVEEIERVRRERVERERRKRLELEVMEPPRHD